MGSETPNPGNRETSAPDEVLIDDRGVRCPLPVIHLAKATREAARGTPIRVLADDPAARHDIPAWCRMTGNELREVTDEGDHAAYLVVSA